VSDLIDTTEMYLRTIYELIEDGVVPMRARIAEQLGHSGPTVSQTIARMERDGLVTLEHDRHLALTDAGLATATRVMRKHRLAERLLLDVVGLDFAHVHDEACRWEHVMSERVELRLLELLEAPTVSPYGNAIPGLEELKTGLVAPQDAGFALEGAAQDEAAQGTLVRIGEGVQALPGFLAQLLETGILPGASIRFRRAEGGVEVVTPAGGLIIDDEAARHMFIVINS
jgi:DtxR family Mn-dependent transcriptional regulator